MSTIELTSKQRVALLEGPFRSMTTSKGDAVRTPFTDEQAAALIHANAPIASRFALSVATSASTKRLTAKQRPWLHKLAVELGQRALTPNAAPVSAFSLDGLAAVHALLTTAREHLKYPKIRVSLPHDHEHAQVVFSLAGERSKYHGSAIVKSDGGFYDGTFFGTVNESGSFLASRRPDDEVIAVLEALAADPHAFLTRNGQESGSCCFCGRELTTPESRTAGYGPVCADHFGLAWGHIEPVAEPVAEPTPALSGDGEFGLMPEWVIREDDARHDPLDDFLSTDGISW